jgi:DNA end-binding protein Ku
MRSIWKGTVSFGLVSIGVKLFSATEERDVAFHQVRRSDGSRIRYRRVAEADGEEVPYGEIAKGYELPSGETVILTDDDFADLPLPTAKTVDVLQFVPTEQIDPIYFAKSYYLEPERNAVKPYVLLRDALESSGMAGLVKVAIRNREQLATLRVRDGVIVLETMIWPDEVREPSFGFLNDDVDVRPQEKAMAESLVSSMAGEFDPGTYTDDYREALEAVIDAKVEGREVVQAEETQPSAGTVVDLMTALKASVEAAKKRRGDEVDTDTEVDKAAPAKQAAKPAKAATAKRAAKPAVKATKPAKSAKPAKAPAAAKATRPAKAAKAPAKVARAARKSA